MSADPTSVDRGDRRSTTYEFFVLALSVLSILTLALVAVLPFRSQSWWLVSFVDTALTIIFVIDFTLRLTSAPDSRRYMRRGGGLFDLLACLPGLTIVRLFRIVRAAGVVRRLGRSGGDQRAQERHRVADLEHAT